MYQIQTPNQTTPNNPTTTNPIRHPAACATVKISSGAINAPTLCPLVKMPFPIGRSRSGNARDTIFNAPGQFGASVIPNKIRKTAKLANPEVSAVVNPTSDHSSTAPPYEVRKFRRSISPPTTNCESV